MFERKKHFLLLSLIYQQNHLKPCFSPFGLFPIFLFKNLLSLPANETHINFADLLLMCHFHLTQSVLSAVLTNLHRPCLIFLIFCCVHIYSHENGKWLTYTFYFPACLSLCFYVFEQHTFEKPMHRHACQECSLKMYGSWCSPPAPLLPFPEFLPGNQAGKHILNNTVSMTANTLGLRS